MVSVLDKMNKGSVSAWLMLVLLIGAVESCAPRAFYRAPLPSSDRDEAAVPLPRRPASKPAPPSSAPPVYETRRKPLPPDSEIKEQNLTNRGSDTASVLKETPSAPSNAPQAKLPDLPLSVPTPLPDDSSLLAKIAPGTSPQRAASLRLTEAARKLLEAGDVNRALSGLERSIAIDSTNGYGYFYLAKSHHKLGRLKESLNFLDVAESRLTGEPFWLAEVYALRGENFRALGMDERAEASFNKALSINSGNRTAAEAMTRVPSDAAVAPRR